MNLQGKIIAVDFDGTCVTHEYPEVGRSIGAEHVLKNLVSRGARLILFTMRSGEHLDDARAWFDKHGIPLWGVNENPEQKSWTSSPKPYAHFYIDDAALGCPLVPAGLYISTKRPYVDWDKIERMLE